MRFFSGKLFLRDIKNNPNSLSASTDRQVNSYLVLTCLSVPADLSPLKQEMPQVLQHYCMLFLMLRKTPTVLVKCLPSHFFQQGRWEPDISVFCTSPALIFIHLNGNKCSGDKFLKSIDSEDMHAVTKEIFKLLVLWTFICRHSDPWFPS